ncbi:MAG: 6-phosphofructokinase [Fibrobacter sp.]|nr:6-phosphofructokinase [Fibrobacter sp.]
MGSVKLTYKKLAILTSGGDAPGMNAAIRSATRTAIHAGWEVIGVTHGFQGLIEGRFIKLGKRDVSGIIQKGGTLLKSSRSIAFKSDEGQEAALSMLKNHDISALVIIGGNGSQKGAYALFQKGFPVVGIASTIDNDLYGSDITLGVDTAMNIALEAIDRIKVTASSHHRAFLVEVMGRNCGYIALMSGIAGGAEAIIIPEVQSSPESLALELRDAYARGKAHAIVVVAEGAYWNAERLIHHFRQFKEQLGFELRETKLGHVQRGGTPGVADRLLGTYFGAFAIEQIESNNFGVLVGKQKGVLTATPLSVVVSSKKELDLSEFKLATILAE